MKPILFSTPMVKAILDGRKTQTRRIVKASIADRFVLDDSGNVLGSYTEGMPEVYPTIDDAPYQPGDILWVRETWGNWSYDDPDSNACYFTYFADYPESAKTFEWPERDEFGDKIVCDLPKRRPSIFMPRAAARIFLRVTDVRVERLQEILCGDMKREGCIPPTVTGGQYQQWQRDYWIPLWDAINAKRGYGWNTNPWVWVIEFERTEKPKE